MNVTLGHLAHYILMYAITAGTIGLLLAVYGESFACAAYLVPGTFKLVWVLFLLELWQGDVSAVICSQFLWDSVAISTWSTRVPRSSST